MAKKPLPPQDVLRQLLDYDPETGKLFWKERSIDMFKDSGWGKKETCCAWNGKWAGKEAFTTTWPSGYHVGTVEGKKYAAQRIIWKMVYGVEPDEIDHIDGDRRNNRLNNLRDVSIKENAKNKAATSRNSSGVTGVCRHKQSGKWQSYIQINRKMIHLGFFDRFDAAVAARKTAEREHGFHQNHGRPA